MSTELKPIVYRGGIVTFGLPSHWREEYGADGGGTFYEEGTDTGTLRLNVLSFEKSEAGPSDPAGDFPEVLPSGARLRRKRTEGTESGTKLYFYRWEVLVEVPPSRIRIVCFTHTVLASNDESESTKEELRMVDSLVRSAEYSKEPGVIPKPWWQFWK